MPPARREKARADPMEEFSQSQSSNDLDYELKTMMVQQYCVKLCKKKFKEEKMIIRDAVANSAGEFSEMSSELVEALKAVQKNWLSMILEHGKLNDKIVRNMSALESHELALVRHLSELKKQAASSQFRDQQIQSLEKMRGVYEANEKLWNKLAGDGVEYLP